MDWHLLSQVVMILLLFRIAVDLRSGLSEVIKGLESLDERLNR
ncbi:MAG: hypothetical protein R3E10_19315 [Gemmatimonadota bacterium]